MQLSHFRAKKLLLAPSLPRVYWPNWGLTKRVRAALQNQLQQKANHGNETSLDFGAR